jgi:DNA polymerase (family X)
VRAYRNAARTVHDLPESAAQIVADPDRALTDIEGIGKDLAEKIKTLIDSGSLPMLDELLAKTPESVLAILRVPGLGPKRAAQLYKELKVSTLDELREACQAHRVQELKGFGAKIESAILQGLDIASQAGQRILWIEADQHVQEILLHMQDCRAVEQISAAGSYRRGKDTIGDLDFLVVTRDTDAVMDHLASCQGVASILVRGDTKMSLRLTAGVQVDLRVVAAESFGAALQYFTGSKEHNIVLRGRAKAKGLKINEYGVFRGEKYIAGRTEEEIYGTLGLPVFPPELREARREFEWADAGQLPELVELGDIRGDLHMHSTWTDGTVSIEEMAAAALERGLKYIAITDHSKRVTMVGGLTAKQFERQWAEIDKLNARLKGITVLKGVEVDILERAAAEHGKMLELNAHPMRLDLDDVACMAAKAAGVPIVIATDAHSLEGLDMMRCGVLQARRGGLTKSDVANTRSWPQLRKLLQKA